MPYRSKGVTLVEVLIALFIIVIVALSFFGAMHPERAIQYRDQACASGCRGSSNPDACYQTCMLTQP